MPLADRPADEGHDNVVDIIEEKLVARTSRNLLEGLERISADFRIVADTFFRKQPLRGDEQILKPLILLVRKFKDHMGLMDDG